MSDVIIYEDGSIALSATVENETVWLSQKQMAELFDKSKKTISEHINNIFKKGELEKNSVIRKFRKTASESSVMNMLGNRRVLYPYNTFFIQIHKTIYFYHIQMIGVVRAQHPTTN